MRKIIGFVMIVFAMMMVIGCSQPTTPIDYTDDRLVTGSPWVDYTSSTTTYNFDNAVIGTKNTSFGTTKTTNFTWTTYNNIITISETSNHTTFENGNYTYEIISNKLKITPYH